MSEEETLSASWEAPEVCCCVTEKGVQGHLILKVERVSVSQIKTGSLFLRSEVRRLKAMPPMLLSPHVSQQFESKGLRWGDMVL